MSDHHQPVTCLPPPLPPKTKSRRSIVADVREREGGEEEEQRKTEEAGAGRIGTEKIVVKASYSAPAAVTTVNLNAAEDNFRDLSYACNNSGKSHVVKILINPKETRLITDESDEIRDKSGGIGGGSGIEDPASCIRIAVNRHTDTMMEAIGRSNSPSQYYFNQYMSSGQMSPSDTLDSGTCSDLDGTPPPLTKKKQNNGVSVTLIGLQKKTASLSSGAEVDSDDNESHSSSSSISCDSLNCGKVSQIGGKPFKGKVATVIPATLLQDIRQRKDSPRLVDEKSYEDRKMEAVAIPKPPPVIDSDMFFEFHLNEKEPVEEPTVPRQVIEDETFAGYKDLLGGDKQSTIRSAKGTVRGVRNRVRAGIATFLQINSIDKNYKEKDAGKVVVYTTTMGVIRETYQACMKVKQILRTLLIQYEERDVFMSTEYQSEIRERMKSDHILVPQVYVDGQHCGDAETVERLNESGELRKILKAYKNPDVCNTCQSCGGYRLLPCGICNGSKKSVHRNHFTTEFVALKCMNCDENGLVRCSACS